MADEQQVGMYVANRRVSVSTNMGYSIRFEKGEPRFVPPMAREEMLQHGILPVNGDLPIKEKAERVQDPMGAERKELIAEAVREVREKNDSGEFTAGGVPKEDAVAKVAGFKVARREINEAFTKLLQADAADE